MRRSGILSVILLLYFSCNVFALSRFFDKTEPEVLITELISTMDDTDLLGQLLILGYFGLDPSPEILEWIDEKKIGGVKIFGWNVSQLERLGRSVALMQRIASKNPLGIPLFIATDQEGGWVRHIKGGTSITPGNISIGATGLPEDAFKTGLFIAKELKLLGINMNFAPTVDIYTNLYADVIGPRSFSSDPLTTATLSTSFFQGQESIGIISTAKHFPGHGAAEGDSHGMLPEVTADFETLWNRELLPYRYLIKRGIPAIMSGHISFPEITDNSTPASGSHYFLTELLREQLGFEGIIITDDMLMEGALTDSRGIEETCYSALIAGNDILMVSRNTQTYQKIWDYLYKKLQEEKNFRAIITSSVIRILKTKLAYLTRDDAVALYPDINEISNNIPNSAGANFFLDQAFRSVSIIGDELIPVKIANDNKILLAAPYRVFLIEGKKRIDNVATYYFPLTPSKKLEREFLSDFKSRAKNYDRIIFCLTNKFGLEMLRTLKEIDTQVTVISTLTPVLLLDESWINSAVAVYGTGYESFMAGFSAILGDYIPTGIVPMDSFRSYGSN